MGLPFSIHQDVRRFQVTVEDTPLVSMVGRIGHHRHQRGPRRGSAEKSFSRLSRLTPEISFMLK